MYGKFHIFYEEDLRDYLDNNETKVRNKILNESEDYILNVNEKEYIEHLVDKFQVIPLEFDFENIGVTKSKKNVPGKYLHTGFFDKNKTYKRPSIKFHIPFIGDKKLLKLRPNSWIMWVEKVYIKGDCVCFEVVNINQEHEKLDRELKKIIDNLKNQNKNCYDQIQKYNQDIYNIAKLNFEMRKKSIISENEVLNSLSIPIKINNSSETYTVPPPKIKDELKVKPKPKINNMNLKQNPTLDDSFYQKIIKRINGKGKSFEQTPHNYSEKSEEHLRDYILGEIQPTDGSATGETFNKSGKTDILIKHANENLFVAECKIWRGKESYLNAITQLIGYLTWRDSKTAIILFVKNKNISSVINTIEECTPDHSNFVEYVNNENESWFNYIFHLDGDTGIKIKIAVLVFHIPKL